MSAILRALFDVCLLRKGPQDLPASEFLMYAALVWYVLTGVLLLKVGGGWSDSVVRAAIDLLVMLGLLRLVLQWRGLLPRYRQTLTAIAGTGGLLALVALPIVMWLSATHEAGGGQPSAPDLIWLVLIIWSLVVLGHILRHALSVPLALGVLFALTYLLISTSLIGLLTPGTV